MIGGCAGRYAQTAGTGDPRDASDLRDTLAVRGEPTGPEKFCKPARRSQPVE
jgi:hypothetical protein